MDRMHIIPPGRFRICRPGLASENNVDDSLTVVPRQCARGQLVQAVEAEVEAHANERTASKGENDCFASGRHKKKRCPKYGEPISNETGWHVHHVLPKAQGGTDNQANVMPLTLRCCTRFI